MFNLKCDGVDICMTGDFDCDNCLHMLKVNKPEKPVIKKPKQKVAPVKQFKRRKK